MTQPIKAGQRGKGERTMSDELREALENIVCDGCGNRIGWNGNHDDLQTQLGRTDWKSCNHCKRARAAIAEKPAERPQLSAEPQVCEKQYHLYVWSLSSRWVAVAQAENVATARKVLLEEIGSIGDGSCPIREQAAKFVAEQGPGIWHHRGAEFEVTDSANLEEADAECDKLRGRIKELEKAALLTGEAEKVPPPVSTWGISENLSVLSPAAPPVLQAEPPSTAEALVRELHGVNGFDEWAAHIAKRDAAIRREAERVVEKECLDWVNGYAGPTQRDEFIEKLLQGIQRREESVERAARLDEAEKCRSCTVSTTISIQQAEQWYRGRIAELRALADFPVSGEAAKEKPDEKNNPLPRR